MYKNIKHKEEIKKFYMVDINGIKQKLSKFPHKSPSIPTPTPTPTPNPTPSPDPNGTRKFAARPKRFKYNS
jgi:hypothetical protein